MSKKYKHLQDTPSDVWLINHGLDGTPVLDVIIEENGVRQKILVNKVTFIDANSLEIRFSRPRVGSARLISQGIVAFNTFDAYTSVGSVVYYPGFQFNDIGSTIGRPVGLDNHMSGVVSPQSGKFYTVETFIGSVASTQNTVIVYEYPSINTLNLTKQTTYTTYNGDINISSMCVWNDTLYFISSTQLGLNSPTSDVFNDFRIWTVNLLTDELQSYLLPSTLGGLCGITTDGVHLFATTFNGLWLKLDMSNPVVVLEQVDVTTIAGVTFPLVNIMYDFITHLFVSFVGRTDVNELYALTEFNGALVGQTPTNLSWNAIQNSFINGSQILGLKDRSIRVVGYTFNNTKYNTSVNIESAGILCNQNDATIESVNIDYSILAPADNLYPSQHDGQVYALGTSLSGFSELTIFKNVFDDTILNTVVLPENILNVACFCVYENKIHIFTDTQYSRYTIDGTEEIEFVHGIENGGAAHTPLTCNVFNGKLIVVAVNNGAAQNFKTFEMPLNFSDASEAVRRGNQNVNGSAVLDAAIDAVTGYIFLRYVNAGVNSLYIAASSYTVAFPLDIVEAIEPQSIIVYGNRLFFYSNGSSIVGISSTSNTPNLAFNNNICGV
jgi:hypothetical protein